MKLNKKFISAPMMLLRVLNLVVVYELTIEPAVTFADSSEVISTVTDVLGTASGVIGQTQQQQQIQARIQQQQQQIQAIVPVISPDSLFPQCKILPVKNNRLTGICAEPIQSPQEYQAVSSQYLLVAQQNQNAYENFMTKGLKLGSNIGKQCFDEQNKLLQSKLDQRVKSLQALINQIENENQLFKAEADKRTNALKDINAELEGGDGATKGSKTRDFSVFLTNPNCKAVIAQDTINSGKTGLRGLRTNVETNGLKDAQKILSSRDSIEQDIRAQAEGVKTYLQQNGPKSIGDFKTAKGLDNISTSSSFFTDKSVLTAGLITKATELDKKNKNIEDQLANIDGIKISSTDTPTAVTEMKNQIEKKKNSNMRDCIYENKYRVHSVNIAKLNFEQLGARSKTTTENFKNEIFNTLNRNISADEMSTEIKKLEAKYGNSVTTKLNSSYKGQTTNKDWLLSDIFEGMKQSCENQMDKKSAGEQYSQNEKYKKSYELISDYEKLSNSMANEVSTAMLNRAINCQGVAYTASPDSCNNGTGGKLNTSSSTFCLKQSTDCATNLQACYNLADKVIKTKEAQMQVIAKDYNNAVKIYEAKQDNLLKQVGSQFMAQSQMLQGYFPGTKFDMPDGDNAFLIKIPEQKMDETLGVAITDPQAYMTELTTKLKAVKEKVKEQNTSIDEMIKERIAELETAYATEAEYWKTLTTQCQTQMTTYKQTVAEQNKAATEAATKGQTDFAEFCAKANMVSLTPGCDDEAEELADAAQKVAGRLSTSDLNRVKKIKAFCRGTKAASEEDDSDVPDKVKTWCFANVSKYADCKTAKTEYNKKTTSTAAIEFDALDAYPEALAAYTKAKSKTADDSDIGEQTFVSCNGVNTGTGKDATISSFVKQFGDAVNSGTKSD